MSENEFTNEDFEKAAAFWDQAPGETLAEQGAWHLGCLSAERTELRRRQETIRTAVANGFNQPIAMRSFNAMRDLERKLNVLILEVQSVSGILLCDLEAWDAANPPEEGE